MLTKCYHTYSAGLISTLVSLISLSWCYFYNVRQFTSVKNWWKLLSGGWECYFRDPIIEEGAFPWIFLEARACGARHPSTALSTHWSQVYKYAPYPVFMNSSSVVAFNHIDEAKGLWQIAESKFGHDVVFSHSRAINNHYILLQKDKHTTSPRLSLCYDYILSH